MQRSKDAIENERRRSGLQTSSAAAPAKKRIATAPAEGAAPGFAGGAWGACVEPVYAPRPSSDGRHEAQLGIIRESIRMVMNNDVCGGVLMA